MAAGKRLRRRGRERLFSRAFNLEDAAGREAFLKGDVRTLSVPGSSRTVSYDPLMRTGIGLSRLGTSRAVALGAYAFALEMLAARPTLQTPNP